IPLSDVVDQVYPDHRAEFYDAQFTGPALSLPPKPSALPSVGTVASEQSIQADPDTSAQVSAPLTGYSLHAFTTDIRAQAAVRASEHSEVKWQADDHSNLYHEAGRDQAVDQPEITQSRPPPCHRNHRCLLSGHRIFPTETR